MEDYQLHGVKHFRAVNKDFTGSKTVGELLIKLS